MKNKFLRGSLIGAAVCALILSASFLITEPALSASGQNECGKICGDGYGCTNSQCPVCAKRKDYTRYCSA